MAADPIRLYNHNEYLKLLSNEELKNFGEKGPLELSKTEISKLRDNNLAAYIALQNFYWALKWYNIVTLQLGWYEMSYTAASLTVRVIH